MSENTGEEQIVVPVTVTRGQMKDVTKGQTYSRESVVFLNNKGQAHMLPKDMAQTHAKKGIGHIIDKKHKDYMGLYKMAVGYDENVRTDKFLQKRGKVLSIEDSSRLDLKQLIEREQAKVAKATNKTAGKPGPKPEEKK